MLAVRRPAIEPSLPTTTTHTIPSTDLRVRRLWLVGVLVFLFVVPAASAQRNPPAKPAKPTASDRYPERVEIAWAAVRGAASYEVYRCAGTGTLTCRTSFKTRSSPYDDTPARAETVYYYRVKACNAAGCSDFSDFDQGQRKLAPPGAPQKPQATDGTLADKVRVTWNGVGGATSYRVHRCTTTAPGSCGNGSSDNASPYDDTGASPGVTFYYRIKACNDAGCSSLSAYDAGTKQAPAPAVPSTPQASDNAHTDKVRVTWTAVAGANSYQVYRCTNTSTASCGSKFDDTASPYDDTSAVAGQTYYYRLTACGDGGCSAMSNPDAGTRDEVPAPVAPSLSASNHFTDKVRVSWGYTSSPVIQIYRCTTATSGCTQIGSPQSQAGSFDDVGAADGTPQIYRAKACTSGYLRTCSEMGSAVSGLKRLSVSTPSASDGTEAGKVRIRWYQSPGATTYRIFRCAGPTSSSCPYWTTSALWTDDTAAQVKTTYYYRIEACNTHGCSDRSQADSGYH